MTKNISYNNLNLNLNLNLNHVTWLRSIYVRYMAM